MPVELDMSKSDLLLWGNLIDAYTHTASSSSSSQENEACSGSSSSRSDEREDDNTFEAPDPDPDPVRENESANENPDPDPVRENADPDPVREIVDAQDDILDLLGYHEYDVTFEENTLGLQLEQMGEMAVVTGLNGFVPGPFKTTPAVHDIIVAVDGETVLRCSFETIISLIQTSSRPTTIRSRPVRPAFLPYPAFCSTVPYLHVCTRRKHGSSTRYGTTS
jgi:hypothetical protein